MNTNLSMPSGSEVESAAFHEPIATPVRSGVKERLDTIKSAGLTRIHHLQHVVNDRSSVMRSSLQRSMQTSPMKWAGIAAGSGLAIGLIGRFLHWRRYHRVQGPQLVVIEAAC